MKQWLPEDDLVYFVMDVVMKLDLSEIHRTYKFECRGQPPFNPTMMVTLLIYALQSRLQKLQAAKKQRNFTDPESRIMSVSGGKDFVQGYNCQAAVDKKAQVIVGTHVTQATQ